MKGLAPLLVLLAAAMASGGVQAQQAAPGGTPPGDIARPLSSVPNAQAIVTRFWMPGLDEGYTPQGLVYADGDVHVLGYRAGGCRLFSLSPAGALHRTLDLPACRHGGGLAALGQGRFAVIDSSALFLVSRGRIERRIALAKPLIGSFGDFDGQNLWIGAYVKAGEGRLWRFPASRLAQTVLREEDADTRIAIAPKAQGMVFHRGALWVSFSGASMGRLARLDSHSGRELASYAMPAGLEDLGSDGHRIWAVSEAGARKYAHWDTYFPLVFAFDPDRLR